MGRDLVIELTDEMVEAFRRVWRNQYQFGVASQAGATREGLAAVLALVERDQPNQHLAAAGQAGLSRWRCNRTSRCIREDGHDGAHAFTGVNDQAGRL
jgi:hypothetical protein